uniref:Uncharacterized protein n=1 Tax=Aegilops tauschii subsp. strangulata TaxID=200361 RepID=A0A453R0P1_AEGTS
MSKLSCRLKFKLMYHVETLQQMANVQYTENMTDEQDAMSGSETLRLQGVKKLDWDHGVYQTRMQLMFV